MSGDDRLVPIKAPREFRLIQPQGLPNQPNIQARPSVSLPGDDDLPLTSIRGPYPFFFSDNISFHIRAPHLTPVLITHGEGHLSRFAIGRIGASSPFRPIMAFFPGPLAREHSDRELF